MSGIYWSDGDARLKTYSSSSRAGSRPVIKIEIEISGSYSLGSILSQLEEIIQEQKVAERAAAAAEREAVAAARAAARSKSTPRRAIERASPPLLLPYHSEDDDG